MRAIASSLIVTFLAVSAFAKGTVTGRASFTLDFESGSYTTEIRHEDGKFIGRSFWGPIDSVNLSFADGQFIGWAGGRGNTNLTCTATECQGTIGGGSAKYSWQFVGTTADNLKLKGSINHNSFTADASSEKIVVNNYGGYELKKVSDGVFTGQGMLSANFHSRFTARLETSGDMKNMKCPGLLAIFMVAPFGR